MEIYALEGRPEGFALTRDSATPPSDPEGEDVVVALEAVTVAGPELARARGGGRAAMPGLGAVGRVEAAGAAAGHLEGARVACPPVFPCGECRRCRGGEPSACPRRNVFGGEYGGAIPARARAPARWLSALAPPIALPGPEAALLGREAALAYTLYARGGPEPGETALVLGEGPIARLCVGILGAKGVTAVALAENPAWAEIAASAGADAIAPPAGSDASAIAELMRARAPEEQGDDSFRTVFETSGSAEGRARALALARPGGVAVLAGRAAAGGEFEGRGAAIDEAADEGAIVIGVAGSHPDLIPEVAALAAGGELDLAASAETAGPDALAASAEKLARGELPGRAAVLTLPR